MPLTRKEQEEYVRSNILFSLLERASGVKHWKYPFEVEFVLASPDEPAIPRDVVMPFAQDLARAIQFYHGAAVVIDLETMHARPARGEAAGYVFFDGHKLKVGSIGYQG